MAVLSGRRVGIVPVCPASVRFFPPQQAPLAGDSGSFHPSKPRLPGTPVLSTERLREVPFSPYTICENALASRNDRGQFPVRRTQCKE
jgi:hypothetical protein